MEEGLLAFLRAQAQDGLLPTAAAAVASERFQVGARDVVRAALVSGLLPARYQRNRHTLSAEQQLAVFSAKVAVVGCGGLGGYAIEELSRLGVGHLVAIDPDVFEDHNLNRQILATPKTLGRPKVEAPAARVAEIDPAIMVTPVREAFARENGAGILAGVQVAVDGLDNIPARRDLAAVCAELEIPMVHGAVAGWYGRVATQHPGDKTLEALYPAAATERGIESDLGVLSCAAAVVASLQVAEVVKLLLDEGTTLRNRCLNLDLREGEVSELALG